MKACTSLSKQKACPRPLSLRHPMTFLFIPNWLFLIDERGHASSMLPDSVNIHYLGNLKHRDGCILQGAAAAARKPFSLPNTITKRDKPSHAVVHVLSCILCFIDCRCIQDKECIKDTQRHSVSLVIQVFFVLTAYKSLKETPAWEHQRSLCCSDNWNRTLGSVCHCHANEAQPAVNSGRPFTRSCREKHMWHVRVACDAHIILRGQKHVLTGFTSHTHAWNTQIYILLLSYWW